jgi:hypothetical protein
VLRPDRSAVAIQPVYVRLIRRELGPLVGFLVPWDSLVCWAPPDLDDDARPGPIPFVLVRKILVYLL